MKFSKTDCWVFLSIPNSEAGGDLENLLDIADAINNSVPECREIEVAINKGLETQIILIKDGKFLLTQKFQQFIEGAFNQNGSHLSLIDVLHDKMPSWCEEPVKYTAFRLSEEDFEKAHHAYLKSFAEAYKKR